MKQRYCKEHQQDSKRIINKDYDDNRRNKIHHKFYNSKEWKQVRELVMSQHAGLCKQCSENDIDTKADVVDHKIPLARSWEDRIKRSNLQPLCHNCHNKKTSKDLTKWGGQV